MPRVAITPVQISRAGVAAAAEVTGDASSFHSVANDGQVFLLVRNSNGASTARVLTVHLSRLVDGQAVTARTYSIAAAASKYIGPFPVADYGSSLLIDPDNAELKISAYHP